MKVQDMGSGLPRSQLLLLSNIPKNTVGVNFAFATPIISEMSNTSGTTYMSLTSTATHYLSMCGLMTYNSNIIVNITPVNSRRFMLGSSSSRFAIFDTTTTAVITFGGNAITASVTNNGDGSYKLILSVDIGGGDSRLWLLPDTATAYATASHAGDATKGFTLGQYQINPTTATVTYATPTGIPGILQDYSGKGNNGALGATTAAETTDPIYCNGYMAFFTAGAQSISFGRPAQLERSLPFSFNGAFYLTEDNTYDAILSKCTSKDTATSTASLGFALVKTSANVTTLLAYGVTGGCTVVTSSAIVTGWHYLAGGWDGTSLNLRINSVVYSAVAMANYAPDVANNLTFGKISYSASTYLTGWLGALTVYGKYNKFHFERQVYKTLKKQMATAGITIP